MNPSCRRTTSLTKTVNKAVSRLVRVVSCQNILKLQFVEFTVGKSRLPCCNGQEHIFIYCGYGVLGAVVK